MSGKNYLFWTLLFPMCVLAPLVLLPVIRQETLDYPTWISVIIVVAAIPVAINFFFGASIYAYWKKKHSRLAILIVNVLFLFAGGVPTLLLWIWALCGRTDDDVVLG